MIKYVGVRYRKQKKKNYTASITQKELLRFDKWTQCGQTKELEISEGINSISGPVKGHR